MRCPQCGAKNPEAYRFCRACGRPLGGAGLSPDTLPAERDPFCGLCGQRLSLSPPPQGGPRTQEERRFVTVLFSDLSGYTSLSACLEPEDIKEITSRILGIITQVVFEHEGHVEKFIGDEALIFFGYPRSREDDPIRALSAAMAIHRRVREIPAASRVQGLQPLRMHSGVNSGMVVTGKMDLERGQEGFAGQTINIASRLTHLAGPDEILVSQSTFRLTRARFDFDALPPARVKGSPSPIPVYRVTAARRRPFLLDRAVALRPGFVGRQRERDCLRQRYEALKRGQGATVALSGGPGSGKSRLVEEFKAEVCHGGLQWVQGIAYPHLQGIPYALFLDYFNRGCRIEDGDTPEAVWQKLEGSLRGLVGDGGRTLAFVGSLYALRHPETEGLDPEAWKEGLTRAIRSIFCAFARRAPTVMLLEDLHWADTQSLELLRSLFIMKEAPPTLFVCVYRPPFDLFPEGRPQDACWDLRLQDLRSREVADLIRGVLRSTGIPQALVRFVQEEAGGNPLYVEEVLHSLCESEILVERGGRWEIPPASFRPGIPATIQGLIASRLDRLPFEARRVLQEASVLGRRFPLGLLRQVSELGKDLEAALETLERADLLRKRVETQDTGTEYLFKHALTQEVVYQGLHLSQRRGIHRRVARTLERILHQRLPEFYETLAFHFKAGEEREKACEYLVKSAEKALGRHALEEAQRYFQDAYGLLVERIAEGDEGPLSLTALLNRWAFVYYYRGDFKGMAETLGAHQEGISSLGQSESQGMFHTWLGATMLSRENFEGAYRTLKQAMDLGERLHSRDLMAFAGNWLVWTCAEKGLLDEATGHAEAVLGMIAGNMDGPFLSWNTLAGLAHVSWYKGDRARTRESAMALLAIGETQGNSRALGLGHCFQACSAFMEGDYEGAREGFETSLRVSQDPYYSQWSRMLLALCLALGGDHGEAERVLVPLRASCEGLGMEIIGTPARAIEGIIRIERGETGEGLQMLLGCKESFRKAGRTWCHALAEYLLGMLSFYGLLGEAERAEAEGHLQEALRLSEAMGARGTQGMAALGLGLLHREAGFPDRARSALETALGLFESTGATRYQEQVRALLAGTAP